MNELGNFIEHQYYAYCLSHNKPYFGRLMAALQGVPVRHAYMDWLVQQECQGRSARFKVLEVGSWAGGSAITWANAIKKYNRGEGLVVCIDPWQPYFDPAGYSDMTDGRERVYDEMESALSSEKIFSLFLHNIKAAGHSDLVIPVRGYSRDVLALFSEEQFDLIFVDGDHTYKNALFDLESAACLVREGGLLCGDDLEVQLSDLDQDFVRSQTAKDCVFNADADTQFHPGVALAVGEFFGDVSVVEGFWAMRKAGPAWEKVAFPETKAGELSVPEHVRHQSAPSLLDAGYQEFNLFCFGNSYFALARALGVLDIEELDGRTLQDYQDKHLALWGSSLEEVKRKIDQSPPVLMEENYRGFDIVFCRGKCYALATVLRPSAVESLPEQTLANYEENNLCISEASLADLKHRLDDGYELPQVQEIEKDYGGYYVFKYGDSYCALASALNFVDLIKADERQLQRYVQEGKYFVAPSEDEVRRLADMSAVLRVPA